MARVYYVSESLGEVTNTSNTTWSDLVSLTFPTTTGKTYAVLWAGEFANQSNTTADYEIQITVDGSQVDYSNNEQRATTEYASHGGMVVVAGDGSSHTVAVQLQAETNGNTIKGKYGRVIALELGANDVVAEALSNQATTSTTMAAAVSAVVPASGDYLLIGTGFTRSFANSVPVYVDLHNGTTGTVQNGSSSAEISSNPSFVPSQQMWKTTLAASDTASFRFRTHTAGSASDIVNARILCLYLPDFDAAYYAETSADDSSVNGTTETTSLTLTETVTANPHLILGQWHTSSTTNSINLTSRLRDAGALVSESIRRVYNAAQVRTQGSMSASVRDDYSAGSRSWTLTREGAAAGNTTVIRQNSAIAVLDLGATAGGIAGTASITEAADTVTSSAKLAIKATASVTEAADTSTATGKLAIKATASITEGPDTVSSNGALDIKGTASVTEAADTLTATGVGTPAPIVGTANITEDADTVSASGVLPIYGVASVTEDDDTLASTGTVSAAPAITGTASITEAPDTVTATGIGAEPFVAIENRLFAPRIKRALRSPEVVRRLDAPGISRRHFSAEIARSLQAPAIKRKLYS